MDKIYLKLKAHDYGIFVFPQVNFDLCYVSDSESFSSEVNRPSDLSIDSPRNTVSIHWLSAETFCLQV